MSHAGAFYAFLARGLGRVWDYHGRRSRAGACNLVQIICLYGLFGATVAGIIGGTWWAWAAAVWVPGYALGDPAYRGLILAWWASLAIELAVIVLFIAAALTHPAAGG